jgi:hypothetical protein
MYIALSHIFEVTNKDPWYVDCLMMPTRFPPRSTKISGDSVFRFFIHEAHVSINVLHCNSTCIQRVKRNYIKINMVIFALRVGTNMVLCLLHSWSGKIVESKDEGGNYFVCHNSCKTFRNLFIFFS